MPFESPRRSPRSPRLMAAGFNTARPGTGASVASVRSTSPRYRAADPTGKIKAAAAILHQKGGGDTARLVEQATRIGTPRLIHEDEVPYTTIKKKVVREVEVPFIRKVKVPTKTKKIVPETTTVRVKTERLQPVTVTKQVKEEYTAMVPKQVVREKVVWVKKIVPETVTEMVPVKKTRMKDVPTVEFQKVTGYEDVEVTRDKVVTVDGFRVDEVQDRKLVEVEETEEYELRPTRKIDEWVHDAHELGRIKGERRLGRKVGTATHELHEVDDISEDSCPSDTEIDAVAVHERVWSQRLGLVLTSSCVVKSVTSGGFAFKAGVRAGDIVEAVGDRLEVMVLSLADFRRYVTSHSGPIRIKVKRGSGSFVFTIMRSAAATTTTSTVRRAGYGASSRVSPRMSPRMSPRRSPRAGASGVVGATYAASASSYQKSSSFHKSSYERASYQAAAKFSDETTYRAAHNEQASILDTRFDKRVPHSTYK